MEHYTIGETIHRFKLNDIAFAYKGASKGTITFVDTANDNRLTNWHADGTVTQAFYIRLEKDMVMEEGRVIVFPNELMTGDLTPEVQEILADYGVALRNMLELWQAEFDELTDEEKKEVEKEMNENLKARYDANEK
jgi:hypothetical protein